LLEIFKSETTQEFSVMIDGEKRFFEISSLSGLYNRAEFMNLAQRELSGAKELNKGLSLLMIDIDFFKNINDTYGHAAEMK
jgi:diguanylate cyclase (GGDEF)-like protein